VDCKDYSKKIDDPVEAMSKAMNNLKQNIIGFESKEKVMSEHKENPMCKCNTHKHGKIDSSFTIELIKSINKYLKMSFILNICLIVFSICV
jgi:hypothetical protein